MASDTITVRQARRGDLAAIDRLLATSYPVLLKPDYPPSVLVTALPLISRAQPRLLASGTYFLVERDGQVLGAGGWTWSAPGGASSIGPKGMAHIRHVVTDHRAVRQGVGRALMTHVFDTAAAAGATALDCLSTLTAVPFYAAMGFREIAPVEVTLRPGISFPSVHMRRPL